MIGRLPILDISPDNDLGPVKAVPGERFTVEATVIREGHDSLAAGVVVHSPTGRRQGLVPLRERAPGTDRYEAEISLPSEGRWSFSVESWSDPFSTWLHVARVKLPLDSDTDLVLEEGARLLARAGRRTPRDPALTVAAGVLRDTSLPPLARFETAVTDEVLAAMEQNPIRELVTRSRRIKVAVHRERALFGSWYEFFPRSEGAQVDRAPGRELSGTFATAAKRLPAIADMGFDVVYLPPIHPVGVAHRKGRDNTLSPAPGDPGSVWAIGSADGGHDAVHPDLGTLADFDAFVAEASTHGLEIALDLALQCSPDHPWVTEHPEWFTTRADGTIAYAENPPKKYQDIYPLCFDHDFEGLYAEILRVVRHWMDHGVRIFRVDNPHTKPVVFWERLLADVAATDPDVLFLAEAFTRPAMMRALAKVGFHQSYTYFTWRNGKDELTEYLTELSRETAHYLRPNFFANTPDILNAYLQHGGRPAFEARAVLAATLSPTWGIYSGFELCENTPAAPGSEEYLHSEKYEYRPRDWAGAAASGATIAPLITRLNELRRAHPSLRELRNLRFHHVDRPEIVCFSKHRPGAPGEPDDAVIVVVNLDPHHAHEATVRLDLPSIGRMWEEDLKVTDELTGRSYTWRADNYVRLDPANGTAHVFTISGR
ncbi:alpha-1,4-glucan--maltose-1-phosphate maltosyltransferase [Nocardiopsis sp. MG754419]|uniref:alpha-1,4-glucan--maltose-1-phosphate maltosyltransferase n=1 Tax=Nocardiopsis sp. MG754419 TaxID=2259865 RepID=UPI001BAB2989|nr:alpha-1,4-glucan--maltose-1-phosphate maltosyltransferase [Nocardiopsis sp. MG754419]MBR8742346.1 alpha-1,4-glucan--maltose-1-phosphate maltosyltransferase [Nocardiopsis sp. MG754419]